MDKLMQAAEEHGRIFEEMTLFESLLATFSRAWDPDFPGRVRQFFAEVIMPHFAFEEQELFPPVLEQGTGPERKLVRELQMEHIHLLQAMDNFKELLRTLETLPADQRPLAVGKEVRGLIRTLLDHARKEDEQFFPLVKSRLG